MPAQLSMSERSKFQQETLVNVAGRTKNRSGSWAGSPGQNELIVVTILLAAETGIKLPPIQSAEELRTALTRLGSLRSDQVCAGGLCVQGLRGHACRVTHVLRVHGGGSVHPFDGLILDR